MRQGNLDTFSAQKEILDLVKFGVSVAGLSDSNQQSVVCKLGGSEL